ncbi:glycoside hydrolase family 18 protein [Streptomyces sp. NPDC056291]|uniref:glycoside hydrolase family 18 protein n=1 Tax=Streptomyces sp. NPDC056291 TaxID=3345772 RepID=UPI0035D895C0
MAVLGFVPPATADAKKPAATGETVPPLPTPMVGGYLLSDPPNFKRVQMDLVTHFFWAFSTIRNGSCTTASTAGINEVLAERQARPDLKVIRSIGGWGAANFSDVSSTDAKRKAFVASCIDAFVKNGATDGFDLDWEFPISGGLPNIGYSPDDRQNFNLLVDEFRTQLNAYADAHGKSRRDFLVTAALPAGRWQDSGNGVTGAPYDTNTSFDLATLGRTLDNINVMTYDMGTGYSPVSMFNQPLYKHSDDSTGDQYNSTDDAVRYYVEHGVPRNKMTLGVEFTLARGFVTTTTLNNGLFQPWASTGCGQTTAANALNPSNTSILINWDAQVQSPYLWNPTTRTFCSYETAHSLGIRSKYAKEQGLNGIFTWQLTGDASGSQLRAVSLPWQPEKVTAAPAPTVNGTTFYPNASQSFSGTVATVAGSSADSLTAIINWGDLTRSPGTVTPTGGGKFAISGTHTYATPGAYQLTVTTIDPDSLNSRMVNGYAFVDTSPYPYLAGLVDKFSTNSGVTAGLNAKLNAASQAPNSTARANKLDAFINQIRAQTDKAVTAGQADTLTQLAETLK